MSDPVESLRELLELMARLRDPRDGCPWDRAQSFATIAPYTLEEAYEVADAIDSGDGERLKRVRGGVGRGRRVTVFGVAPQLAAPRQCDGLWFVAFAGRIGAVVLPRREDVGTAPRAFAADQMGTAGPFGGGVGGEPSIDRRFLADDLWHRASLPSESARLKRVAVLLGRVDRHTGCIE